MRRFNKVDEYFDETYGHIEANFSVEDPVSNRRKFRIPIKRIRGSIIDLRTGKPLHESGLQARKFTLANAIAELPIIEPSPSEAMIDVAQELAEYVVARFNQED